MPLTILYFGAARERAGRSRETVDLSPSSVEDLLAALFERHPDLRALRAHLRIAVNQEFVALEAPVPENAEVALLPPVAGGAGRCHVVDVPLALEQVVARVSGVARGAVVTFSGQVRDQSQGKRVLRLEYEAYVPMAEKVLEQVCAEAAERWPGAVVAIDHRVGTLLPGELAVVIAAAAPHRREAFCACEHAIERLKADAPIWKRELYEDGAVWLGLGP